MGSFLGLLVVAFRRHNCRRQIATIVLLVCGKLDRLHENLTCRKGFSPVVASCLYNALEHFGSCDEIRWVPDGHYRCVCDAGIWLADV